MKMHWSWTGGSRKRSPPRHFMFNICSDTSAKASLLEQLVINKPRHPWNYDILNTSPSSLILHLSINPSIHPSTYPLIPCSPTILCGYLCWWWNETFRSTCITIILWVRLLILSWNLEEKKSEKLSEMSYTWGIIKLTSSDEVIRVWYGYLYSSHEEREWDIENEGLKLLSIISQSAISWKFSERYMHSLHLPAHIRPSPSPSSHRPQIC